MDDNVRSSLGAVLVGGVVAVFFSGTVTMQVILYSKLYARDPLRIKLVVALLWLLDILHTIFTATALWDYLIVHWGQNTVFDTITWGIASGVLLTALMTFVVQCFFAYRVYTVSHRNAVIAVPIALLACVRVGAALVSTARMITLQSFEAFRDDVGYVFTLGLSASVALDVFVTAALCYFLERSRTGFASMDAVIDTLTVYTVQNGFLTFVTTLVALICWVRLRSLIFLGLHLTITKLYANAFMATLNARKTLRMPTSSAERDASGPPAWQECARGAARLTSPERVQMQVPAKVHINVETAREVADDGDGDGDAPLQYKFSEDSPL